MNRYIFASLAIVVFLTSLWIKEGTSPAVVVPPETAPPPAPQLSLPDSPHLMSQSQASSAFELDAVHGVAGPAERSPYDERSRLVDTLRGSGRPTGDSLDNTAYDVSKKLTAHLSKGHAGIQLNEFECARAGCMATVLFKQLANTDGVRIDEVLLDSAFAEWPGGRIVPPALQVRDGVALTLILVRPDTTAQF
jgi:hypothetical protein